MTVKFQTNGLKPEFESLGIPIEILELVDGKEFEIEDDDYDGEILVSDKNEDDNIEPDYYDITFHSEGYSITLNAISNYHLSKVS